MLIWHQLPAYKIFESKIIILFIKKYRRFTQEAEEAVEKIYDKIFANY